MAIMRGKDFAKRYTRRMAGRRGGRAGRGRPGIGRIDEIAELAEAVADEHCPAVPVCPRAIARAKGISVSFGQYGEAFDGMLEHEEGLWHVYCNRERVGEAESPAFPHPGRS